MKSNLGIQTNIFCTTNFIIAKLNIDPEDISRGFQFRQTRCVDLWIFSIKINAFRRQPTKNIGES
ncbi:hypothetical protein M3Y98_01071000 [Aphelenchoides besseyi]|nr:hypothetical protein M3Y98_01071000 [Aphelenchoides besseyi]